MTRKARITPELDIKILNSSKDIFLWEYIQNCLYLIPYSHFTQNWWIQIILKRTSMSDEVVSSKEILLHMKIFIITRPPFLTPKFAPLHDSWKLLLEHQPPAVKSLCIRFTILAIWPANYSNSGHVKWFTHLVSIKTYSNDTYILYVHVLYAINIFGLFIKHHPYRCMVT